MAGGVSRGLMLALLVLAAAEGTAGPRPPSAPAPSPAPAGPNPLRERIARLALAQVAFGSVSLLPVRFEHSRLSGPFEDAGRTLYCVSSRMHGRTFGAPERPKAVIRDLAGTLSVLEDEEEACTGHRTEPFPELDSLGNAPR